jgi:uncharacterized membrane protein YbhN (UPF0104 family)
MIGRWTPAHRKAAMIAGWIIATILVVICARTVDWRRALELLERVRPAWLLAAVAANAGILICWAAFWRALRPPDETRHTYGRMFEIVATASSLMNTVPFGGGHASSIVLLARRGEMTHRSALSVFALDQLGEGLAKLAIFLLVAAVAPLPTWMRAGVLTATLVVGVLFVVLTVASRWAVELAILKAPRRSATALSCVLGMKVAQLLGVAAVQYAFGADLPLSGTVLVLAAITLGTMVPLSPGNLGTFEASAFLAYRYLGVSPEQALSLAVMQHVCFMLPAVGVGYFFVSAHALSKSAMASR